VSRAQRLAVIALGAVVGVALAWIGAAVLFAILFTQM
jgi:hypothetical protein